MNEQEMIEKLDIRCDRDYFDRCVSFAKQVDKWEGDNGLKTCLERLANMGKKTKTSLYKDFAPYSFGFSTDMFVGGVIFHGKHDNGGNGSAPTFSVSLEPCDGWSLHT